MKIANDNPEYGALLGGGVTLGTGTTGDVSGGLPGPITVVGIGGVPFNGGTPSDDFVITYDAGSGTFGWEAGGASGSFVTTSFGGKEDAYIVAASGASQTLDLTNGNLFDVTLTANCTFAFSGATAGKVCSFTNWLRQPAAGGPYTATWPLSVVWSGGTAPTLATAANALDELVFISTDGGASWLGHHVGGTPFAVTDGITTVDPTVQLTFVGASLADLGGGVAELTFSGDPASDTSVWMPLTTVVSGAPELVWDGSDSLIPTLTPV